jgi:hypothetical protein
VSSRFLPIALVFAGLLSVGNSATLEEKFRSPPNSARPWVYWAQSGQYSLKSATADLEAMKKSGIGGVLRMDCSVGQIPNASPFLGEQWRKQFVHSVHECERLGLEFAAITGPGRSGTGGPWIKAEQSIQHLVPATVNAKGPAKFSQVLPLPQPRISRYHRRQTPQIQEEISAFFKDVAVFAFPRREPGIENIQDKALHIRNPFTSMPGVRPYLPSPASYPEATAGQVIDRKTGIRDDCRIAGGLGSCVRSPMGRPRKGHLPVPSGLEQAAGRRNQTPLRHRHVSQDVRSAGWRGQRGLP